LKDIQRISLVILTLSKVEGEESSLPCHSEGASSD